MGTIRLLRFAVFAGEMQLNFTTRALLGRVHHTGIKWTGVDVQTDGALIKFARIDDPVHRIGGIDRARLRKVHFDRIERLKLRAAAR